LNFGWHQLDIAVRLEQLVQSNLRPASNLADLLPVGRNAMSERARIWHIPLLTQQRLEHRDDFEVRCRRDVGMPSELLPKPADKNNRGLGRTPTYVLVNSSVVV